MRERTNVGIVSFVFGAVLFGALGYSWGSLETGDSQSLGRAAQSESERAPGEAKQEARRRVDQPDRNVNTEPRDDSSSRYSKEERDWMENALDVELERRRRAEIHADDTGVAVLEKILDHGADPLPLFEDFATFSRPLRVDAGGELVIPVTPSTVERVFQEFQSDKKSRVVFDFAPGRYEFRGGVRVTDLKFVTFRGAGTDATILAPQRDFVFAEGVDNLKIEDLTIDSRQRSDGILDSRGMGALLLSRVRALGFDAAAGHSAALGLSGKSYIAAEDCEFLGGYGRRPYSGSAVSLRDRGFVYLKNCLFRELGYFAIADGVSEGGSVIKIENCRSVFDGSTGRIDPSTTVVLANTSFEHFGRSDLMKAASIDLGGNAFTPIAPSSLPSMKAVVESWHGKPIVAIKADENLGANNIAYFRITTADGDWTRYFNDSNAGLSPRLSGSNESKKTAPNISAREALSITQSADADAASPNTRITSLELSKRPANGMVHTAWEVRSNRGDVKYINADTGAFLE